MSETKVALITGASRGIGRHLALDCARHGLAVAVNYRTSEAQAGEVVEEIRSRGGAAVPIRADVADEEQVGALVAQAIERFGRIDCLINNAGAGVVSSLGEVDATLFDDTIRINLRSAFLVSRAVVPHMMAQGGGRLIFLSSLAARTGGLVSIAYAASKAGTEGLMHYYATYLLPHGITANAIAPALIESDIVKTMTLPPPEALPLRRFGRADEIWPAVRMILETEYMTGQTIHINAGRYMT